MSISKFLAIHIPLSYTEGTGERGGGGLLCQCAR